jgi:hypothetical protein
MILSFPHVRRTQHGEWQVTCFQGLSCNGALFPEDTVGSLIPLIRSGRATVA